MSRKSLIVCLAAAAALLCAGCRKNNSAPGQQAGYREIFRQEEEEPGQEKAKEKPGQEEMKEEPEQGAEAVKRPEEKKLAAGEAEGEFLFEDEESLYLCCMYKIMKIDKESGKTAVIWRREPERQDDVRDFYFPCPAVLVGKRIYFISSQPEEWYNRILCAVNTDGTEFELVAEFKGKNPYPEEMFYQEGRLSVCRDETRFVYEIYEDGTVAETVADGEVWDKEEEKAKDDKRLVWGWEEKALYLTDETTGQERLLSDVEEDAKFLAMDEEYVYLQRCSREPEDTYIYERISWENGERSVLFSQGGVWEGMYRLAAPEELMPVTLYHGYMYYAGMREYRICLLRRDLADPSIEEKTAVLYDTGIAQAGGLDFHYETVYSGINQEKMLSEIRIGRLVVDEKFAGAEAVNRCLKEHQEAGIAFEKEETKELEQAIAEGMDFGFHYSFESMVSEIFYFDGNYLSFYQWDYTDWGGAHGRNDRTSFTFDLKTGKRLFLSDIIEEDEEELKEIVTGYFEEYINQAQADFWNDALQTVREGICMESGFYLTEEGIRFYFPPYALACYAAGFQEVTVPYREFQLKIPVGGLRTKAVDVIGAGGTKIALCEDGTEAAAV